MSSGVFWLAIFVIFVADAVLIFALSAGGAPFWVLFIVGVIGAVLINMVRAWQRGPI